MHNGGFNVEVLYDIAMYAFIADFKGEMSIKN